MKRHSRSSPSYVARRASPKTTRRPDSVPAASPSSADRSTTRSPTVLRRVPDIVIHPGQRCENVSGQSLALSMRSAYVPGATRSMPDRAAHRHVRASHRARQRPPRNSRPASSSVRARIKPSDCSTPRRGSRARIPGQQAVLDRLLDVLVVDTLRSWYQQQSDTSSWWDAHHDPLVGAVLALIHDSPEQAWTIASLARSIGVSRANMALRFNNLVGEPPITYLTKWRLSLAADVLCQPTATVTNTARSVGYGSPFAFSTAFKRRYGISPHQHRTRALAVPVHTM